MAPRVNKTENSKNKQDASPVKRGPGRPRKVVPEVDVEQRTPAVKIVNKKLRPDSPDIVEIEDSDEGHRKFLEYADEVIAAANDEEDDTALDPNDSMYPEPPRSSRIQVGHQDRPITPPLNTRSGHTRTFAQRDSPDGIPDAPGMTPDFSSPSKRARTAKGKQIKQYESPDDDDDVMAISNNNESPLAFKSPGKSILPTNKSIGSYHREDDDDDDDDIFPETISNVKRVDAKKSSAPAPKA
ncbi:hypothetical protein BDN70DRAFT_939596 [Pholiota conissans]|uniref:Uncharacterized protein n=1 Tax=Pholiota conissans TaxID=109636 RepID=A0A9P6CL05_9AGAR|nr:hypothetical protein BDN70DRAFT_939596 [Pholiota conissans]